MKLYVKVYSGGGVKQTSSNSAECALNLKKNTVPTRPIAALVTAAILTAALLFTACPNAAKSPESVPTPTPKHVVTFSVDGGNGTLTAKVGGSEIATGAAVEQGKIVEFTATADDPAQYDVDFWTVDTGSFEEGSGVSGSTSAKVKVVKPVSVTVKFKLISAPFTKATVFFGVTGTGGTLKAEVEGTPIATPAQVNLNKTIVFTAVPDAGCVVKKWTLDGADIASAGTNAVYNHTVTANANIAVQFKTAPVDIYVSGKSGGKGYVWKNGTPTELDALASGTTSIPCAVRAQGNDVYIAGYEDFVSTVMPRVWKKDGSLHWISTDTWSSAYDIAFYKGKTIVAGETSKYPNKGPSLTDITTPGTPAVTFLYKKAPPISYAGARALCAGTDKLYAAGYKYDETTHKNTVYLWTKPDSGSVTETELGPRGNNVYTGSTPYGLCTAGSAVYVAAGTVWKVEGSTGTLVPVSDAYALYALCTSGTTVYAAGWTNASKAAVWKIEGTSASLYKELSNVTSGVFAFCAAGNELFAAGYYYDTDNNNKPVWWRIADDLTVAEYKLGSAEGEAFGICVTAQ